jgi:glycosyltransferase involved in cell wall biosynthesis
MPMPVDSLESMDRPGGTTPQPSVGVFIDYRFRESGGRLTVERAFALFLFALAPHVGQLRLMGRLDPSTEPFAYEVPDTVVFDRLPHYESLRRPLRALPGLLRGIGRAWRALDHVDVAWVLGPNPLAVVVAVFGLLRRRRVVLGVRQDTPRYVRSRHPRRRSLWLVADLLQGAFVLLARRCPVVVVGEELAEAYGRTPALHVLHVSLVPEDRILAADPPARAEFGGRVISVGRLDTEKNPLLMADVLALLVEGGGDWRLEVYGEGPLDEALRARLAELGLADRATLHGYVPADRGLVDAYRSADALLHVSWTEGMPQVLIEGFAARLPTVATAVGGVAALAGDAALLVEPGDPAAPAAQLRRIAGDPALRARLADAAEAVAREHTMEIEAARVARFLEAAP